MNILVKKFLNIINRPHPKKFVQVVMKNVLNQPKLYTSNADSFLLQIDTNDYMAFVQEGDILKQDPTAPGRRIYVTKGGVDDLVSPRFVGDSVEYTKNGFVKCVKEITQPEVELRTAYVEMIPELVASVIGNRTCIPFMTKRGLGSGQINLHVVKKSQSNYQSYLGKLLGHQKHNGAIHIAIRDSNDNEDLATVPPLEQLKYLFSHSVDGGFTFIYVHDEAVPRPTEPLHFQLGPHLKAVIRFAGETDSSVVAGCDLIMDLGVLNLPVGILELFKGEGYDPV